MCTYINIRTWLLITCARTYVSVFSLLCFASTSRHVLVYMPKYQFTRVSTSTRMSAHAHSCVYSGFLPKFCVSLYTNKHTLTHADKCIQNFTHTHTHTHERYNAFDRNTILSFPLLIFPLTVLALIFLVYATKTIYAFIFKGLCMHVFSYVFVCILACVCKYVPAYV